MVKIKICGITNVEDATWAANLGTDYLGLIFAKQSKRRITAEKAQEIVQTLPPYIEKVGLFANEAPQVVNNIIELCKLDALQLHGEESPDYCNQFKGKVKIIKGFRMKDEGILERIPEYDVDFYLLDGFVEGELGGTGQTFNWDLALKVKEFGRPIFLAGGLKPENVAEAIKKVEPYAVDVASGVENSPRRKNKDLMQEFIKNARKAGSS